MRFRRSARAEDRNPLVIDNRSYKTVIFRQGEGSSAPQARISAAGACINLPARR